MRMVQDFNETELRALLDDFYNYFKNGFEFEEFLKPFLESIGLTEVIVTKKTKDGGVDLTAVRKGIEEVNNFDIVKYRVQAKRYAPSTTMQPEKIDALRGNLLFNEKGLFITTAKVSKKAKEDAVNKDSTKPVFVIDGTDLVQICIEKQIGFAYKPIFSTEALDEFTQKDPAQNVRLSDDEDAPCVETVEKTITSNDVRARIISVPRSVLDKINPNDKEHDMKIVVNNAAKYDVTFCPGRNYFSKVTDLLRKFGMLQNDGTITEKNIKWAIDEDQVVYLFVD